jgi:hypothetical protein
MITSEVLPPYLDTIRRPEDRELYLSGLKLAMAEKI